MSLTARHSHQRTLHYQDKAKELELAMDHPALALFDVCKAHRCDIVLEKLRQNQIYQVLIQAGCTGELQPFDVSGKSSSKHR